MKKVFKYIALATVSALALASCDLIFDGLEGDLSKVGNETMFRTEAGITRVLAGIYNYMPSNAFSTADKNTLNANSSRSAQSYYISAPGSAVSYSQLRVIHNFLRDLEGAYEKGVINEVTYNSMKGEALFIRAYMYFNAVRVQGGQPILTESLDDKMPATPQDEMVYISRSTEKETWDWVIKELADAAELLPENPLGTMRIGKYTALAMAAKAALWAGSVSNYWDRAPLDPAYKAVQLGLSKMEKGYAEAYYRQAVDYAQKVVESNHFALYGANPKDVAEATKNLGDLFLSWNAQEGILGKAYKTGASNGVEPSQSWSTANQVTHGYLNGAYSVTLNLVESFDDYDSNFGKADGKLATGVDDVYESLYLAGKDNENNSQFDESTLSKYTRYNTPEDLFKNKDARFQAWILYPGCTFRGTYIWFQGGLISKDGKAKIYPTENINATALNYKGEEVKFYAYGGEGINQSGFMNLPGDVNDNLRSDYCFMVRKYLDPSDYNDKNNSPWYEMRYSELLLIHAEAVAELKAMGKAYTAQEENAQNYLNAVRHRAGFKDDIALTVENVLHECKVEFALEAKWPEVLFRRRAYAIQNQKDIDFESERQYKQTLVPVVDLSGAKAQYIFVRAYSIFGQEKAPKGVGTFTFPQWNESYYSSFSNTIVNNLVQNNQK